MPQRSEAITDYVFPPTLQFALAIFDHACQISLRAIRRVPPPAPHRREATNQNAQTDPRSRTVHCFSTVHVRPIYASAAGRLALGLTGIVAKDLDWLEAELNKGNGRYLGGDHVTGAGTMVAFSIHNIFCMKLAPQDRRQRTLRRRRQGTWGLARRISML